MTALSHRISRLAPWRARCAAGLIVCAGIAATGADPQTPPQPAEDGAIPQPLRDGVFEALMTSPPFTRSLGAPDSLILTGVARMNDDVIATLLDTRTMQSLAVSRTPNHDGWQLLDVGGNPALVHTLIARIQIRGGEIVSIRYQKPPPRPSRSTSGGGSGGSGSGGGGSGGSSPPLSDAQLTEAKNAAVNYREGFNADGYPREPPAEMVAKLSRLSVDQREDINRQMFGYRNRGLGMEDRRKIYEGMVDRAIQSRR